MTIRRNNNRALLNLAGCEVTSDILCMRTHAMTFVAIYCFREEKYFSAARKREVLLISQSYDRRLIGALIIRDVILTTLMI